MSLMNFSMVVSMEKINFEWLDACADNVERANFLMTFIVNRAANYDKLKYNTIIVHFTNDSLGVVTWEICHIVNTFFHTKFITSSLPKGKKSHVIKWRPRFWVNHLRKKDNVLEWDCESTTTFELDNDLPKIYSGISKNEVDLIVNNLYQWSKE